MNKSGINSDNITKKQSLNLENVSSLTITNYSAVEMNVTINDVTEIVPAYDAVKKHARSFDIPGDGTFCDIKGTVDFAGGSGRAVLRYRTFKPNNC